MGGRSANEEARLTSASETLTCALFQEASQLNFMQPAETSWNKPFKTAYRELYNEWMALGRKQYKAAGNVKPPDKLLCLEWVKRAWERVTQELVVTSFKACGISNKEGGS